MQFFHVGMGFKRRIRMFSVDADSREALLRIQQAFRAQLLAIDPQLALPF